MVWKMSQLRALDIWCLTLPALLIKINLAETINDAIEISKLQSIDSNISIEVEVDNGVEVIAELDCLTVDYSGEVLTKVLARLAGSWRLRVVGLSSWRRARW